MGKTKWKVFGPFAHQNLNQFCQAANLGLISFWPCSVPEYLTHTLTLTLSAPWYTPSFLSSLDAAHFVFNSIASILIIIFNINQNWQQKKNLINKPWIIKGIRYQKCSFKLEERNYFHSFLPLLAMPFHCHCVYGLHFTIYQIFIIWIYSSSNE